MVVAPLAACGRDAKPRHRPGEAVPGPRPVEHADAAVSRVRRAVETGKCASVEHLLHSVYGELRPAACASVRLELGGFEDARVSAHGTGAVVDYKAFPGRRRVMVLVLDADRRYALAFVDETRERSIGTRRPGGSDTAARAFVAALRGSACGAVLRVVDRQLGMGTGTDRQVCRRVSDEPVRRELRERPGARPVALGGNGVVAFYGLRTSPRRYYTLVLVRRDRGGLTAGGGRWVAVNAFPA